MSALDMLPNPGRCPTGGEGRRVVVELENGRICGVEPVSGDAPPGWAADGRNGCNWALSDHPFAIRSFRILR